MSSIPYKLQSFATDMVIIIDFSRNQFKTNLIVSKNKIFSDHFIIPNVLYHISEQRVKTMKDEYKDALAIQAGLYTRNQAESAQLLLQADEIPVDYTNSTSVEKAYQNLFEQLMKKSPDIFTPAFEWSSWLIIVAVPNSATLGEHILVKKIHLEALKSLGAINVGIIDHLSAAFISQRLMLGEEKVKHPAGVIINISGTTHVGVVVDRPIAEDIHELPLGFQTILDYALAVLRDFNVKGFRPATVEEWIIKWGTCNNSASDTIVSIRDKEVNIRPILNTPALLFDYYGTTSLNNKGLNSISEGIFATIEDSKKRTKKYFEQLLQNIIVVGHGSQIKYLFQRLNSDLSSYYPKNVVKVVVGSDPLNSVINGLYEYIQLYPIVECYNANIFLSVTDIEEKERVLEQYEQLLKNFTNQLKDIRKQQIIDAQNLANLNEAVVKVLLTLKGSPTILIEEAREILVREAKDWAKDFMKSLQDYKKIADKSLEGAEQAKKDLSILVLELSKLPRSIQTSFDPVLQSTIDDINTIYNKHKEKLVNQQLKIIIMAFKKINKENAIIDLYQLSSMTMLDIPTILGLIPEFLKNQPDFGFLDDRLVSLNETILLKAGQFLNVLRTNTYKALEESNLENAKVNLQQALEYCDFLVRGYNFINKPDIAERFIDERQYLIQELQDISKETKT